MPWDPSYSESLISMRQAQWPNTPPPNLSTPTILVTLRGIILITPLMLGFESSWALAVTEGKVQHTLMSSPLRQCSASYCLRGHLVHPSISCEMAILNPSNLLRQITYLLALVFIWFNLNAKTWKKTSISDKDYYSDNSPHPSKSIKESSLFTLRNPRPPLSKTFLEWTDFSILIW